MLVYKTWGYSNCRKDNTEVRNPVLSNSQSRLLRQKENPQWTAAVCSQGYNREWPTAPYQAGEHNGDHTQWGRAGRKKKNEEKPQYIVKHINYKFQSKTEKGKKKDDCWTETTILLYQTKNSELRLKLHLTIPCHHSHYIRICSTQRLQ